MRNKTFSSAILAVAVIGAAGAALASPAARQGSPTSHGGAVVQGSPNVLIAGTPAARLGDFASCPLVCSGTGPPHTGGPIVTGSATVLINGTPAARVGSMVGESCATSTVSAGVPTVDIGG